MSTTNSNTPARRASSLDALRGYAILTMVLSATVAGSILPAWMYHAQTPPPSHAFIPEMAGLTWVDLVFPFFLFAMGAAFPFSLGKKLEKGVSRLRLSFDSVLRGCQLTFFAIFIQHFYPFMLSNPQDVRAWLLALCCFAVLFPMFMRIPLQMPSWVHTAIKVAAYGVAVLMMWLTDYAAEEQFSLYSSNIIILLLANMAIFGSIVYIFTANKPLVRVLVLLVMGAIFVSSKVDSSWANAIAGYTPLPWMYRFGYLSYLFIVIPGSFAGDILKKWLKSSQASGRETSRTIAFGILTLSFAIVIFNLVCLQSRWSFAALVGTVVLLLAALMLVRREKEGGAVLWRHLLILGAILLIFGLLLEPAEGGIKKDGPTFSYLLGTSGLACMALIFFHILCDYLKLTRSTAFLVMSGMNPMIAYVSFDLLISPMMNLLGLTQYLSLFHTNAWLGFLQGVILTSLAMLVTMGFTKIKVFWRT